MTSGCLDIPLFDGVATDETTSVAVNCRGYSNIVSYITGTGVTSSGVVTIEEAPTADYSGTWSAITTVNASDVTGGATKAVHTAGAFNWVRHRVSTAIGGGGSIASRLGVS